MRRSLADAILKAFSHYAKPNLSDDMPDHTPIPLLVNFTLGDLRSLERGIQTTDEYNARATRA